jgi:hypothetical protein
MKENKAQSGIINKGKIIIITVLHYVNYPEVV